MDPLAPLRSLAERWRSNAQLLQEYGAESQARVCEKHAETLEDHLRAWELELLTLEQAAAEAGLAYDTVQRKVAAGEWPNRGQKGQPRVRRCDVHPGLEPPELKPVTEEGDPDVAEEVLRAREVNR